MVQELHWSPEEACVTQGAEAVLVQLDGADADWFRGGMPCYMPTDLPKLDHEAFHEAVVEAEPAVATYTTEAELKRICREGSIVEKNTRGSYEVHKNNQQATGRALGKGSGSLPQSSTLVTSSHDVTA